MFTYALDEYGDFEGLKNTNKPIYIGGVIYDDHSIRREEVIERKRILQIGYIRSSIDR